MIRFVSTLLLLSSIVFAAKSQTEPLWLRYPAISPDGSSIVFTYKGDLYKVFTNGGNATVLTSHAAHDFMPVWSRDGRQVAFASDRYGNFDVFVMPATGGNATRLTHHSNNDYPSDFSPDGREVLFSSSRLEEAQTFRFPYRRFRDLYTVPVKGGREKLFLNTAAELARFDAQGNRIVYQDCPGPENEFRKHHVSSMTRDIWLYDVKKNDYQKLSQFSGEDRNPCFSKDGETVYYLSEKSGTFNVWKLSLSSPNAQPVQLTTFDKHPVRNLTVSDNGTLCFSYDGGIYVLKPGQAKPELLRIFIQKDLSENDYANMPVNGGASEFDVSPSGKEIAFVFRGEVFVTSTDGGTTKRITNTPEQERSVSFSPDGKSLLYAGERNGSWNLYIAKPARTEDEYFFSASRILEEPLLDGAAETFQPRWSPDGKEVAFLEERVTLRVVTVANKSQRTILGPENNYSYSDGDQWYQWSPDGRWFLVDFLQPKQWIGEVGLVKADGTGTVRNLTQSGFNDGLGQWALEGKAFLYRTDRDGMKNHASWGAEQDVYMVFFDQAAYDRFKLTKEEFDLFKEKEEKDKEKEKEKEKEKNADKDKAKTAKDSTDKKDKAIPALTLNLDNLEHRKVRLTIGSSRLQDAVLSKDGEKLYTLTSLNRGMTLWETALRTGEVKSLQKFSGGGGGMMLDKTGKKLFIIVDGKISKLNLDDNKLEGIAISGEMQLNAAAERAYMYEHVWRQVDKKFYVTDLHKTDWPFYKKAYARFLPHVGNSYEFSELLSELLGELNASHTGCGFRHNAPNGDQTASLGLYYDDNFKGKGLKITEVMNQSPVVREGSRIKPGTIITHIDGVEIGEGANYLPLLNRKHGSRLSLQLRDPANGDTWEEIVKPISLGEENELRYRRWVDRQHARVEALSGGRVGYLHVRGMNNESYRQVYEDALGKHAQKEALVVDTRFNGGGWLHDDLATFLNGKTYLDIVPRGQNLGQEPQFKWRRASCVLMSEANYSDAHMFPFTYKTLGIGKLVGMPVAGTGTAVWWEDLIDPTLTFGIPQVGMRTLDGQYLENTQLEPDVKVFNNPGQLRLGVDEQLDAAVRLLLGQ